MQEFRTKIDANGRIIIPAQCRKILDLQEGDEIIIQVNDDEATFLSFKHAIEKAKATMKKYNVKNKSLVEELIKMRKDR